MILSNLRASAWKYTAIVLAVLAVAAAFTAFFFRASAAHSGARADAAEQRASQSAAELQAAQRAIAVERAAAKGAAQAQDEADQRNEQIETDYRRRIAGADAERDRLRKLWQAERATDQLADSAAAAAAAAEQDRLRRDSAARIVRAVELVQSERDEAVDRYEAVRRSFNGP